jgi:hypothetical protein
MIHTYVCSILCIYICRKLAEADLKVAQAKVSVSVGKGWKEAEVVILKLDIDKAQENLAEAKLLAAIVRNASATEIEARNQSLILTRAAHLNHLPASGNNC